MLRSLVNGQIFTEWVGPALLKAYMWQVSQAFSHNHIKIFAGYFSRFLKDLLMELYRLMELKQLLWIFSMGLRTMFQKGYAKIQ